MPVKDEIPTSSSEQRLIDLTFELVLHMYHGSAHFDTQEKCVAWVARQLRECGFPTQPCGMSWGMLLSGLGASESPNP